MRQAQDIVLQSGDAATCERKLTELFNGTPLAGQAAATTQQLYNVAKIELLKYNPEWDFRKLHARCWHSMETRIVRCRWKIWSLSGKGFQRMVTLR